MAVSFVRDRLAQAGKDTAARALKTELFAALLRQDLAFLEQQDMMEVRSVISNAKTACLPLHATAAEMQEALNALPNVPGHHDMHKGADHHQNPEWCYPDPYTRWGEGGEGG